MLVPGDYAPGLAVIFGTLLLIGVYLAITEKGLMFRGDTRHALVFISGVLMSALVLLHWPLGLLIDETGLFGQPALDRILFSISLLLTSIGLLWIRARVRYVYTWFSGIALLFLATLVNLTYPGFGGQEMSPAIMVSGLGAGMIFLSLIFLQYERAINTSIESDIVRGDAHYLRRDYGKALASYDDALAKSQMKRVDVLGSPLVEYDVPWYSKGSALVLMGKYEEGIKCLDMALAINPNNEVTWVNKGNAHSKLGEHDTAMECYRRAIECNPFYEIAWNNLGNAYARQKNYVEALKHYNRALKINGRYDDAWINKGYVLAKMGRREQAVKCLNHVGSRAKGQIPPMDKDLHTL
jgi:tetratricopeptide (TPR) repeat protein